MERETNLRQADAIIKVEGVLSEKHLERVFDEKDPSKEVIKGTMVIQTGEVNFVTLNVYVGSKKKDGKPNQAFAGMETVMATYKSIAEVGAAEATKVRVNNGQLAPQTYFNQQGNEAHSIRYNASFFNSIGNAERDHYEPKATFEVEMVISRMRPEVYSSGENQGEETGRAIIEGWVPTYTGIETLTLIAPAEDGIADGIMATFDPGQTVRFLGELVNSRVEKVKEIPVVIGKPRIEKTYVSVNELRITGCSAAYDEEPMGAQPAAYNIETIQAAVAVRNEKLEEEKRKAGNKPTAKADAPISKPSTMSSRGLPF